MNRILLEQSDGFTVGPTVNPCTKGLWLWNKVMTGEDKDGRLIHYLIVDTEGIGALDTNSQHDSIIFSLALLLSSNFIYNSVGSIDEGALNNLSLVVNLTKHIHVKSSNAGGGEDDGADFAQYFPSFLWLVRDFTLQLVNSDGVAFSSKEYLERALQPVPGFTEQIEAKNRIRRMLTHFFPERDCFTMVRPVTDESLLQKLSSTPSEQLRPEFVTQMGTLRGTILNSAKTKKMNGTELDGLALINLAYAYTESINTGSVPSIQNAWNYICQSKCQHALTAALKNYENAAKDMLVNLPMGVDELDMTHRKLEAESWKLFEKDAIGDGLEVRACVQKYIFVYIYTCISLSLSMYMHIDTYAHIHTRTHTHTHTHTHAHTHKNTHTHTLTHTNRSTKRGLRTKSLTCTRVCKRRIRRVAARRPKKSWKNSTSKSTPKLPRSALCSSTNSTYLHRTHSLSPHISHLI